MASLLPQLFLDSGAGLTPSDGALLYFNVVGSGTDKDTYTTAAATVANANPVVADSKGVFPPIYISGEYDWVLQNKNAVQQNTGTVSELATSTELLLSSVKPFPTLAAAVADTGLIDGDAVSLAERTTGNGGGAMWDVVLSSDVTENTYNIVQCTGVGTLSLVLRLGDKISIRQYGATGDGVTDDTGAFDSAINLYNKTIVMEDGAYLVNNIDIKSETTIEGTLLAFMYCSTASGAIFLADTTAGDVTNIRLKGFAAGVNGSLTGCAFIRQTSMTNYYSYGQFEDIETFKDFLISYDIYPIYTTWVNGRDGFQGNFKGPTHQAVSCIPADPAQAKTTNANSMYNFKSFGSDATLGAMTIQQGFNWTFYGCAWEKNLTCRAVHALGIIGLNFIGCYFESNGANEQIFCSVTTGINAQGTRTVQVRGCHVRMDLTTGVFITFGSGSRGSVTSTLFTDLSNAGVVMTNTNIEEAYDTEAVSGAHMATFAASIESRRNNIILSSSEILAGNIMPPENANTNMLPIGPSGLGSTNFSVSNFTGLTDVATVLGGAGQAVQVTISGSGNAIWFTIPALLRDFFEGKTVTWSLLGFGDVTATPTAGSTAVWEDVTPTQANTTATGTGITSNQAQLQQGTITHTIGTSLTSLHFGFVMGGLAGSKPLVFETMSLQLGEIKPDGLSLV